MYLKPKANLLVSLKRVSFFLFAQSAKQEEECDAHST
jgi:hypothetical protein